MTYRLTLDANEISTLQMAVMACASKIEAKVSAYPDWPDTSPAKIVLQEQVADLNALRAKIGKVRERAA
jgi:hypothetical protein